jgi:uncharacterized protein (TIGR02453 family)
MTVPTDTAFAGFPREGLEFLAGLAGDNSRAYFDAHRDVYEAALLAPAKAFVVALGEELRARVAPGLRAEPRVNGSILRINRDIRFTTDKRPYKEYLDFWFWEGEGPSRAYPGLFMRLRPAAVGLGAGMHRFEASALHTYRAAVADDETGRALEEALAGATAVRGADHPRGELLRHDGLYVGGEWKLPRSASSPGFVRWTAERLQRMAPVERWLSVALADRSPGPA